MKTKRIHHPNKMMKKKIRRVPNSDIGGIEGGLGFVNNRKYTPPRANPNVRINRF
jgi:hypothetical protein